MSASEHLRRGDLKAAVEAAIAAVKASPTEESARTLLFECLCFAGDLDRAEKHLDVLASTDPEKSIAVAGYKALLAAERIRRKVFEGTAEPEVLDGDSESAPPHLEGLRLSLAGDLAGAKRKLEEAEATRAPLTGRRDGETFRDFRDADDVLGPFLETFVGSRYLWISFAGVRRISVVPPQRLRDLLWAHATVELRDGEVSEVTVPVLYPGTHESEDDALRLGRKSDWVSGPEGPVRGIGQRVIFLGEEEGLPFLEFREAVFDEKGA